MGVQEPESLFPLLETRDRYQQRLCNRDGIPALPICQVDPNTSGRRTRYFKAVVIGPFGPENRTYRKIRLQVRTGFCCVLVQTFAGDISSSEAGRMTQKYQLKYQGKGVVTCHLPSRRPHPALFRPAHGRTKGMRCLPIQFSANFRIPQEEGTSVKHRRSSQNLC